MKILSDLTDPVYTNKTHFSHYENFWLRFMNDKRDLPFLYLLTRIHIFILPIALLLFTPLLKGWAWWLVAGIYFYFSQFYFKGRFGLMFHCLCHRKMFKPRHQQKIHGYISWVICPLFGHTPESYFSHHMGMHHVENNNEEDSSSTMHYQRDSFKSFLSYFFNFLFLGVMQTFRYLYIHKRKKLYTRLTVGEWSYIVFCIVLCFVNLKATLIVCVFPLLFARFVMMLGNWAQHSFIDGSNPENIYTNSINCINTPYNHTCWNDGYHIIHHLRPGMHYTDMPQEFLKRQDEFARQKAIVFDGIHYLHVFYYLMTRQYNKLASSLVNINNTFETREQAICLMRERTRRIPGKG